MREYKVPNVVSIRLSTVFDHYGKHNQSRGRFGASSNQFVSRRMFIDLVYDAIRRSFGGETENEEI